MLNKNIILILLLLVLSCTVVNSQMINYQAVNLTLNSGFEFGSVDVQTKSFDRDQFGQRIYETKKIGTSQFKFGIGYNYIFGPRFGYGFEFTGGLGFASSNSYEYYGGGVAGLQTYEVKEKLNFIGLSYLLDFAVLGDLEGEFAVTISPEIGIQGSRFVTTFDDYNAIFEPFGDYTREVEWHNYAEEDQIKVGMFAAFFKIGGAAQFQISDYWYAFGGLKYAFVYSGSDNDYVKRNRWLDLDLGFRFMML